MKQNVIKDKSFAFSLRVIKIYKFLTDQKREFVLSKQLLRSGSSIGAMVREAEHSESKADFIHKMSLALKEANETDYWIELLFESGYISQPAFESISYDSKELVKILTKIVKTSKGSVCC